MGRRPGPTRLCGGGQEDRCGRSRGGGGSHDLCALSRAWLGPRAGAGSRSAGDSRQDPAAGGRAGQRAAGRLGGGGGAPVPVGYAGVDKKIVVVAAEAEAVRTIFARYLELGSVRVLAQDLDRRGIRSKPRRLSNGRTIGGGRFGVGALAHLLKNRF